MPRFGLLLFGFSCFALPAQSPFAQAAQEDSPSVQFTLNARTVIEDVVVMDKNGRAVPGLRGENFQVFENGKPQTITFFEPNFATTGVANPSAPLPPNTFTNSSLADPGNVTNVLLLDALNSWPEDRMYAHVQMVKYLASLPPGQRFGIFTLTSEKLNLIWGLNRDSSALRAAVAGFALKHSHPSSTAAQKQELTATLEKIREAAKEQKDNQLANGALALQNFFGERGRNPRST